MSKYKKVSRYLKISLPLRQEDGSTVCHTLQGEWLAGIDGNGDDSGRPFLGSIVAYEERKRWGQGYWYVIRSASGKLVVYRQPISEKDSAPSVAIYESFEAMQPHVPPSIYDEATESAGLKEPPRFLEVPLEGV